MALLAEALGQRAGFFLPAGKDQAPGLVAVIAIVVQLLEDVVNALAGSQPAQGAGVSGRDAVFFIVTDADVVEGREHFFR